MKIQCEFLIEKNVVYVQLTILVVGLPIVLPLGKCLIIQFRHRKKYTV